MSEPTSTPPGSRLIDARQPRLGQGITSVLLFANFIVAPGAPVMIPILAVVMGLASLFGPTFNLYAYLFKALKSRFGPPKELEEPWPPRFANLVGFVFLTVATVAWLLMAVPEAQINWVTWGLGLIVAALAGLAATTGLCVGCEFFVIGRRIITKGAKPTKVVVHPERAA